MRRYFYIKCNTLEIGNSPYLYWSGVAWTKDLHRARRMESENEAQVELAALSPPVIVDKKGPGPEVFEF